MTTYADPTSTPVSSSGYVNLVVGSATYNLNISGGNNLDGLVQAINNANASITAEFVDNGSLSISTNDGSATTIQLNDMTPTDLISDTNQGSDTDCILNNIEVTRTSNTISDLISGMSFTLDSTTSSSHPSVTLSVSTDPSQLSDAWKKPSCQDYNSLEAQMAQQEGYPAGHWSETTLFGKSTATCSNLSATTTPATRAASIASRTSASSSKTPAR